MGEEEADLWQLYAHWEEEGALPRLYITQFLRLQAGWGPTAL